MQALDDVSLEVRSGERLAIVGENGAGKSTLMNVLYGLYRPDTGELSVNGKPVFLRSPREAISLGIGMVHQHFMLVPTLSVAENIVLGAEPVRGGALLDLERADREVAELSARFGFKVEPKAIVENLSVGSRQKVEILKALHRGAKVLILDEPTAVLTPQEADELFAVIRRLSAEGTTVVLISHKLKEVLAFAERIAVMRRGKLVAVVSQAEASAAKLAELMVGAAVPPLEPLIAPPTGSNRVLRLAAVSARGNTGLAALRDISLEIRAGEIVGIAGVDGNGQRELAEVVTGLRDCTGVFELNGVALLQPSPALLRQSGVAHIPEDRHRHAMVSGFTVEENLALGRHRSGALIDFKARRALAEAELEKFDVRPRDPEASMQALSGGNQQKVVVAREVSEKPKLLVAVQPTRGLDIAAIARVRKSLTEHAASGGAVLLVSLDLEEVMALSHRLYVIFDGRIVAELPRSEFEERRIGHLMLGSEAARAG